MNTRLRFGLLAAGLLASSLTQADERLPRLPAQGATLENLTVSGLSSGAFMAVQFHVAHSSSVRGVGALAGGPYYCARGNVLRALSACMSPNWLAMPSTPDSVKEEIDKQAAAKKIDPPANLKNSRIWLFSGGGDSLVDVMVVDATHSFYSSRVPVSRVLYERLPVAGHAMITPQAASANACDATAAPYINRCGQYDAPGRLLSHILGPLQPRASRATGALLAFSQSEFARAGAGLAEKAYAYIPTACRAGGCRIHVAFHGCRQNVGAVGDAFARQAGYNEWAESNKLIVLYPQTSEILNNNACWDWWGYTGPNYHTREAPQISAVWRMVERLAAKP